MIIAHAPKLTSNIVVEGCPPPDAVISRTSADSIHDTRLSPDRPGTPK